MTDPPVISIIAALFCLIGYVNLEKADDYKWSQKVKWIAFAMFFIGGWIFIFTFPKG